MQLLAHIGQCRDLQQFLEIIAPNDRQVRTVGALLVGGKQQNKRAVVYALDVFVEDLQFQRIDLVGGRYSRQIYGPIRYMNMFKVISDDGEVYLNNSAWIMALYALEEYREWACRLAHPMIAPFARQAFEMISKNRHTISRWLSHDRPEEIAGELKKVPLAPCAVPDGTVSDYLR